MKVAVLSSLPPQKGITPYTVSLLEALASRGDLEVEAVGFRSLYPAWVYPGGAPEADGVAIPASIPIRRTLSWWNPISWLYTGATLRCDVLHAQWWSWFLAPAYAVTLGVAKARGKSVVITVHNVNPHDRAWWKRALNSSVLRIADQVVVHSERNRRALEEMTVAARHAAVVPIGVQSLALTAALPKRDAARDRLGIARDARGVLAFGNIRPYKGVNTLLSAARLLRPRVERLRVIVAGELWKGCRDPRDLIRSLAIDDIAEARIGYATEEATAALLAAADVVVFPYRQFDGQSAAATLALSYGKPLIVSDAGGLPDLVLDPRSVVPAGNPHLLAEALGAVLLDPQLRAQLESDSRTTAAAMSWNAVAARTVEVYRAVLSRRSRSATNAMRGSGHELS